MLTLSTLGLAPQHLTTAFSTVVRAVQPQNPTAVYTPPRTPIVEPPAPPLTTTDIPLPPMPVEEIPGAGPVAIDITPPSPGPLDIFSAENFVWWKPVLIATLLAAFGGTVIAVARSITR